MLTIELSAILIGALEPDLRVHRELEHELAVLALADLQEGSLVGHADVVAFGVDEEESGRSPVICPPTMNVAVADDPERRPVSLADLAAESTDVDRGFVQVRDRGQALVVARRR